MADTNTPFYNLIQPEDGASDGTWGPKINGDLAIIDGAMHANATAVAGLPLTANTLTLTRSPTANAAVDFVNNSAAPGQTQRWFCYMDNTNETGGNVNSDLRWNSYSDAGAYLGTPLSITRASGTVNVGPGGLTIQGNLLANNVYPDYNQASQWVQFVSGTWYMTQYISGWWDGWNSSGGQRTWVSPNGQIMTCDGSGNLGLAGSINAGGNVQSGGSAALLGGNATYPCYAVRNNWYFFLSGNLRVHQWSPSWYDAWRESDGMRIWQTPSASMTLDGSGNLNMSGTCSASTVNSAGNVFSHAAYYLDNANGSFIHRDSSGTLTMQIYCNTSDNIAVWANRRTGYTLQQDNSGYFIANCAFGLAFKAGGGNWAALSDRRIKDVIGSYKAGLKEVLQLEPVEYIYKGNERTAEAETTTMDAEPSRSMHAELAKDKKTMVGYVADDIMKILPETVTLRKGWIDDEEVDDLKMLDSTNVIHALVNAVKELHAELQALKAAR